MAVYAVVLYHAGLAWAAGGFIGVDLFFVLSGYLVSNVLLSDLAGHGNVRLLRFYARRARRLIPAAALAVVGTAAAALALMPSLDRGLLDSDARAASLWYANWHFLRQSSDYFAIDGPESPFIHFWSLSIEEQFYLAFPLTLLAVWKLRPRLGAIASIVVGALIVSVTLQIVLARNDVNRAYLGTDARVYQILAGAVLALLFWRWNLAGEVAGRPVTRRGVQIASALSLIAFVVVCSSSIDVTVSARGLAAAAASVTLIGAIEVGGSSPLRSALSWRPLRYLGQISYGTYLWHWPVLVLARSVVDMSPLAAACVSGVLGTGLAALSAELVELPIRRNQRLDAISGRVVAGGIAMAAVSGLVIAPALLTWERRPVILPKDRAAAVTPGGPVPDLDWEAIARSNPDVPACEDASGADCFVHTGTAGTMLVIGDSHARMLIPTLVEIAAERQMALAVDFGPSCPWQDGLLAGEPGDRFSPSCAERREITYGGRIDAIDPDVIVLAGFPRSVGIGGVFTDRPELTDLGERDLVRATTDASIRDLWARGHALLVVEPLPILENDPLSCLSGASDVNECVFAPLPEGIEEQLERSLAVELNDVATTDLDDRVCPGDICPAIVDDVVVHRDRHHLTPEFAGTLVPDLTAALDTVIGDGSTGP